MSNDERKYELAENLREDYYEVALFMEGEEDAVETMWQYGAPVNGIVDVMDCTLMNACYDRKDWSKMSACITFPGEYRDYDLLYMPDLTEPMYEVIADVDVLEMLQA